jgi:hypothetical protein
MEEEIFRNIQRIVESSKTKVLTTKSEIEEGGRKPFSKQCAAIPH